MANVARRKLLITSGLAILTAIPGVAFAQGETLADIRKRGKIVVGTEAAYEPYEFLENGKIVGLGSDVLQYVVGKLGVQVEQLNLPFSGLLPGLMANKFDFIATSVGINPERAKRFAYTRPIGVSQASLMVLKSNQNIRGPEDLVGKVVGTQLGSSNQSEMTALNDQLKAKSGKGFGDLKLFQTFPDAVVALGNGQVEAASISSAIAVKFVQEQPQTFRIASPIGTRQYLSWVTRPQDLELRAFINQCIAEIADNGKLAGFQKKWLGTTVPLPAGGYLPPSAV
jgi:polar amino acid transport system substrate-binding protein